MDTHYLPHSARIGAWWGGLFGFLLESAQPGRWLQRVVAFLRRPFSFGLAPCCPSSPSPFVYSLAPRVGWVSSPSATTPNLMSRSLSALPLALRLHLGHYETVIGSIASAEAALFQHMAGCFTRRFVIQSGCAIGRSDEPPNLALQRTASPRSDRWMVTFTGAVRALSAGTRPSLS